MSSPFYSFKPLEPGARERVEARLRTLDQINKERPCWGCAHHKPAKLISCGCQKKCNFNHDCFIPIDSETE